MIQKRLSPLEQEVMIIVWKLKSCGIREVMNKFKKPLAYTTVATLLLRLYTKGMVNKKYEGPKSLYSPKSSSESYGKKVAKSFIMNFFDSFGESAIVSFAESVESLPRKEREELVKLLMAHHE